MSGLRKWETNIASEPINETILPQNVQFPLLLVAEQICCMNIVVSIANKFTLSHGT